MARAAARASARPRRARPRPTGRICSPPGGSSSSGSPSRAPCVLVFEDLQWAEPGLLDFVEYLLEWSRKLPLFVVALARPELPNAALAGAGRATRRRSALEPLSDEAMDALLDGFVPGLPARAPRARSSAAPRAFRSTRSRRCGCCSTAGCSSAAATTYRPTGPIEALDGARDAARAARGTPRRADPRGALARPATHRCSARPSRSTASPHSRGRTRPRSSRSSSASSARRYSPSRRTRARRSAASSGSSRTC